MKNELKKQLISNKFWVAAMSVLGTATVGILGILIDNYIIVIIGTCCCMIVGCVYEIAEATVELAKFDVEYSNEKINEED